MCLALRDTKLIKTLILMEIMSEILLGEADRRYLVTTALAECLLRA